MSITKSVLSVAFGIAVDEGHLPGVKSPAWSYYLQVYQRPADRLGVSPEHDLISVFNGWTLHDQPELSSWTAFQDRILPAVR